MAGLPEAQTLFNAAFIVVLASLLVQGWTIGPVARFLGIIVPPRHGFVDRQELELPGRGDFEIVSYVVHPESAVGKGQRIPRWARPSLVVRDGHSLRPHRFGRAQAGDQVYVITTPDYVGLLDRLFAAPVEGADDPRLYGEFELHPDSKLADVANVYDVPVAGSDHTLTIGELLRRELAGDIEQGDRIAYGPVDLIVRRVNDDHGIEEVGLALEHGRRSRPSIPVFQNPREIAALFSRNQPKAAKQDAARPDHPPPPTLPPSESDREGG
jgi:cell volume regulation protein A